MEAIFLYFYDRDLSGQSVRAALMTGEISNIDSKYQNSLIRCQTLPFTIPVVESLVDVPVLGSPSCHLLHVTLGYQLLQFRYLPHPVEYSSASHVEYFGCSVLAVFLGEQSHLCGKFPSTKSVKVSLGDLSQWQQLMEILPNLNAGG